MESCGKLKIIDSFWKRGIMMEHHDGAWRCGLIDVGSNTVRAAVFEVEGRDYRLLADDKDFCSLIACVDDGVLSEEGIERLCRALTRLDAFCCERG